MAFALQLDPDWDSEIEQVSVYKKIRMTVYSYPPNRYGVVKYIRKKPLDKTG